jgi:hypothetical protein
LQFAWYVGGFLQGVELTPEELENAKQLFRTDIQENIDIAFSALYLNAGWSMERCLRFYYNHTKKHSTRMFVRVPYVGGLLDKDELLSDAAFRVIESEIRGK